MAPTSVCHDMVTALQGLVDSRYYIPTWVVVKIMVPFSGPLNTRCVFD